MRVLRRAAVLVLLGLTFGVPGVSLARVRAENAPPRHTSLPHSAFDLLTSLSQFFTSVWSKEGCRIDPWGQCLASTPTADEGCGIDPWGCTQSPSTEAGCTIDPLGSCAPDH